MASVTQIVGTAATTAYATGDTDWTNPSNVTTDDSSFAISSVTLSAQTDMLQCTMSGNEFAIPSDARIDGIEVEVSADTDGGSGSVFNPQNAQLRFGGYLTGLDLWDDTIEINPGAATHTFGGSSENWGLTLTPEMVNDSSFGVSLRYDRDGGSERAVRIYLVKITVHYTESVGSAFNDSGDAAVCMLTVPADSDGVSSVRAYAPGLDVKAALVFMANNNRADLTSGGQAEIVRADGMLYSMAAATATAMYSCETDSDGGVFETARSAFSTRVARLIVSSTLTVSAVGDGYVEISWSVSASQPANIMVVLVGGSEVSAHVGTQDGLDGTVGATSDITAPGFEPDVVIALSGMERVDSGAHDVYGGQCLGFVHNGSSITHASAHVSHRYLTRSPGGGGVDLTDLENTIRVGDDIASFNVNWGDIGGDGEEYELTFGDFDSSGFTVTASNGDGENEDGFGYLALKFGANGRIGVGTFDTPTSTGSQAVDLGLGFTPTFVLFGLTGATSLNTRVNDTANGDGFAVAALRSSIQACADYTNENGQNPTDASNRMLRGSFGLRKGDQTDLFDAALTSMDSGGVTLNVTAADATARKGVFLAFGSQAATSVGSGTRRNTGFTTRRTSLGW